MLSAIADTGPLVALLDRGERHHGWVASRIGELQAPLLVCEPVLVEAMHLLARLPIAQDRLFGLLENGALSIAFRLDEHVSELRRLHQKYRDRPMSLADACVVRMSELFERHVVLTLDSDFSVYRKHGRVPLSILHPSEALKP
jgi:predicted nucleic acid-binding protein